MDPKTYEPQQPPLIAQLPPVQMPLLPQVRFFFYCYMLQIILNKSFFSMLLQAVQQKIVFD